MIGIKSLDKITGENIVKMFLKKKETVENSKRTVVRKMTGCKVWNKNTVTFNVQKNIKMDIKLH